MSKFVIGGLFVSLLGGCVAADQSETTQDEARHTPKILPNGVPMLNPFGAATTFNVSSDVTRLDGDFFQSFGTNGRVCATCHQPTDGWTVIPSHIRERFEETGGTDPIFRLIDGANSPNADVSTVRKRYEAYSMLLTRGLIRVGIGVPTNAEFTLAAVDDPYHYASAAQLSLFRRPLPSANLNFLSTVMWDGRETIVDTNSPALPDSNCVTAPFAPKCFRSIDFDLQDQAQGATLGHAQAMVPGLTPEQQAAIASFEEALEFAQQFTWAAGDLDAHGANGGPENLANVVTYFGHNDNFGDYRTHQAFTANIFDTYNAWTGSYDYDRAAVARGQALFNSKPITISGVGGLNGSLGLPASFVGTCGTCHDSPDSGNHTVPAPLNIGLADASRRTPDMPLYTLQCNAAGVAAGHCTAGQTIQTTDPGRALITGAWADVGKFKGPTLRGMAARAPYFHNGSAADIGAVIDFYNTRFNIGFSKQERSDLIAFLSSI